MAEVVRRFHLAPHLAVDDDLAAYIAAGLEQNGVHPDVRLDARRLGLHHLGAAHFQPVAGDKAVQGHVLALERGHPVPVLRKNAAERRAEQAFARAAHGALHHNAFCHGSSQHLLQCFQQSFIFRPRAHGSAVPAGVQPRIIGAAAQDNPLLPQLPRRESPAPCSNK